MARSGGFEPPTAWFAARYSIQLSYERASELTTFPHQCNEGTFNLEGKNGALGRIRTSDRLVRSQVLYPAELRARIVVGRVL